MMSQNSLSSSFLSAVAAFFSFGNSQKTESVYRVCAGDPGGLSGVAKYLQNQEALLAKQKAEQLERLEALASASRVTKYLREQAPLTSVDRYALRQAIAEKQARKGNPSVAVGTTGVDKYLQSMKPAPVLSSVEKYLRHQESLPQPSKVAKYMAKQAALAALQAKSAAASEVKLTGVAKYVKHQEELPQPSKVAKYMARQAFLEAQQAKPVAVKRSETGVDKYVKHQDDLPHPSKVAKYLARQALAEQHKSVETETGVDRYMRHQG